MIPAGRASLFLHVGAFVSPCFSLDRNRMWNTSSLFLKTTHVRRRCYLQGDRWMNRRGLHVVTVDQENCLSHHRNISGWGEGVGWSHRRCLQVKRGVLRTWSLIRSWRKCGFAWHAAMRSPASDDITVITCHHPMKWLQHMVACLGEQKTLKSAT